MPRRFTLSLLVFVAGCASVHATKNASSHDSDAMVIGTIHMYHLAQPGYPMSILGAVLSDYAPDLVLVEIRPEAFSKGNLEDGPLEMTYVTEVARSRGIAVEPIDWWLADEVGKMPDIDPAVRDDCERELGSFDSEMKWPPTFEDANGEAAMSLGLRTLNAQARCFDGNPSWNRRQAWFHHQAELAIRKHSARRTLAFVGAQHRPELEMYLRAIGFETQSPLSLDAAKLHAAATREPVPSSVVDMWREGLARLRLQQQSATGSLAASLAKKIAYYETAIGVNGACCAPIED